MRSTLIMAFIALLLIGCKKTEDNPPFVNEIEFNILTDVPFESLTMIEKLASDNIVFPKQPVNFKKSYNGSEGSKIYEYSEKVKISANSTIELIIPKNSNRKLFDVKLYDQVTIKYFYDEDDFTKKRFVIPEKK